MYHLRKKIEDLQIQLATKDAQIYSLSNSDGHKRQHKKEKKSKKSSSSRADKEHKKEESKEKLSKKKRSTSEKNLSSIITK